MFAKTTPQAARDFLGDVLYDDLREHFEKELMVSGTRGMVSLARLLKQKEPDEDGPAGGLHHSKFRRLMSKSIGHKLLTLLARDGYTPNEFFPAKDEYCNKEWVGLLEVFGLAIL